MNLSLKGKMAMVCGGSQGIGRAAAAELAQLGAEVVLVARNADALREAAGQLDTAHGQQHHSLPCDFSDPAAAKETVESFLKRSGPVHILVNNSGGPAGGPVTGATADQFEAAFAQHVLSNHLLMQAVLYGMKREKYGRIINIISTSVKQPIRNLGVSNTIRAAVANWSKTLAGEVAAYGITVNNVLPGATLTGRLGEIISNRAGKSGRTEDAEQEDMLAEIPMKRFADPAEIGAVVAFLASPAAAYITGTNVTVDGGRTASL
jgi:3-oxoacyl-[acyl-carrier protein] reductase